MDKFEALNNFARKLDFKFDRMGILEMKVHEPKRV